MNIRVIDSNFAHATSCSNGNLKVYPKYFNWYRGNDTQELTVFVDAAVSKVHHITAKTKIWMLLEPPSILPGIYQTARRPDIQALFDYILTFDKALAATNPDKFVWYPMGGCWIEPTDRLIHPKTKLISIIASEKNFTEGHRLRHQLIQQYGQQIDLFGRAYRYVPYKLDALKDYRYTIVIENCQLDNYFSEKLIDPLVVGTVPLYWGAPNIHELFPDTTISINYLPEILRDSNRAIHLYQHILDTGIIQKGIDQASAYVNTEDWLWLNFFSKICTTTLKT